MLTETEIKVLTELSEGSNWNDNGALDFKNPDYNSQVCESTYQVFLDAKDRAKNLNMNINNYKGALGSLAKKGCVSFYREDGEYIAVIDSVCFKNIRGHLGF